MRSQQKNSLLETLRSILNLTQDRQQQALLWKELTGKSSAAFYRYLRELGHKEGASMKK